MRCEKVEDKDKKLTIIMCGRGRATGKRCQYCGAADSRLCDYPVRRNGNLTTCDVPMCGQCTFKPEPDRRRVPTDEDYCRAHATMAERGQTALPDLISVEGWSEL